MYLKSLELIGFKSFAEKTKLEFEPGMTAIVGPNGCGKSNVSDSLRWVLGEQSAKAMRGAKMEDVIFNGTDSHKPLNIAEVSLTLADCESTLGVEYNEVTITRRVYRSGEGEYFINRAPCRLKDIQRLFMDTGIGTNAYSLMEQGRIDKILSSHPEDRRAVFEEASGITKFKADRREAIRKLEQTEANLLRLADILREVKRQIISLQRQAGKARRYQTLIDQLKAYDLFATRERLTTLDEDIRTLESRISSIVEQDEAIRTDIEATEAEAQQTRADMAATEKAISDAMEASVVAKTELERVRELIRNNEDRIQEMTILSERDTRDEQEARSRLVQHETGLAELVGQTTEATGLRDTAEKELGIFVERLNLCESQLNEAQKALHKLRTEQLESESRAAQRQNELAALEAQERQNVIRRERLAAEHAETQRAFELFDRRRGEIEQRLATLREQAETVKEQSELLAAQKVDRDTAIANIKQKLNEHKQKAAAKQAQIDLLQQSQDQREGYPEGTRRLLDPQTPLPVSRDVILGPLAEHIRAEPDYQLALEAALRPWMDAVVVKNDAAAIALLGELDHIQAGAARMLVLENGHAASQAPEGDRLVDHLKVSAPFDALVNRLLACVVVVAATADLPAAPAAGTVYVSKGGALLGGDGTAEFWKRGNAKSNPLARQQLLNTWGGELVALQKQIGMHEDNLAALANEEATLAEAARELRIRTEQSQRELANAEGESRVVSQEAKQASSRVETVAWELKTLNEQHSSGDDHRTSIQRDIDTLRDRQAEIRATISSKNEETRDLEQRKNQSLSEVTEKRVLFSEYRQRVDNLQSRQEQLRSRIQELQTLIEERSRGVNTYKARIADLLKGNEEASNRIEPLALRVEEHNRELDEARALRAEKLTALNGIEANLRQKRAAMEDIRQRKSTCDVEVAQQRMRRQNLIDRVTGEYKVELAAIQQAPEPEWENGEKLDRDALETVVAEIRTKIDAIGPVNLVAIEEHRELEERLAFLTTQQNDLVNAKTQLMDLIREINKKTTEMFSSTFELVNKNFQEMFTKLFGGGTAKLVLVDEGDVLESGIEIIARPPGKKLQTVSLLSGGERTMTAVALLFSLYQVKPSPFCMLDELDAALDEANIGRFVKMLQGFLDKSQFIVITHNRMTISAAETLYGVTMEKQGVSKIVSVKFHGREVPQQQGKPEGEKASEAG